MAALATQATVRHGAWAAGVFCACAALQFMILSAIASTRSIPRPNSRGWRFPSSFSITGAGALFILAIFLIALAAVNTGNNLLYLFLALQLSAVIVSGIVARLTLRSLFISLQVPENVFVGESVSIKITLTNKKRRLSSFSILVEDLAQIRARRRTGAVRRLLPRKRVKLSNASVTPVLHHAAYFPAIPAGKSRSDLISQSFSHRGKYALEGLRISTRFPLGFFRRGERVSVAGEILVYPSIREISSDLHLLPFMPGKMEGRRVGQGESLYAIRKYQEGESARLIHWKATAKTDKLLAREFARDEESEFCLVLDSFVYSDGPRPIEGFEKAVSLAASLAAHFVKEGAEFEYLSPEEYVPRRTGTDHLYRILRSLAVAECGSVPIEPGTDLHEQFSQCVDKDQLQQILSEKVFKIILTSRPRGTLPAPIWHSSYVIYFDEL